MLAEHRWGVVWLFYIPLFFSHRFKNIIQINVKHIHSNQKSAISRLTKEIISNKCVCDKTPTFRVVDVLSLTNKKQNNATFGEKKQKIAFPEN